MQERNNFKPEQEQDYYVELDIEHWPDHEFKKLVKKWQVALIVLSKPGGAARTEIRLYGTESSLEGILSEPGFEAYYSLVGQIRSVYAV